MFNPRWMFHASQAARLVQSEEELASLSRDWADSPQAAYLLSQSWPADPDPGDVTPPAPADVDPPNPFDVPVRSAEETAQAEVDAEIAALVASGGNE